MSNKPRNPFEGKIFIQIMDVDVKQQNKIAKIVREGGGIFQSQGPGWTYHLKSQDGRVDVMKEHNV